MAVQKVVTYGHPALRAISKNFNKKYLPPESYIRYLNKKFSPYCSVATWYLWRSIDPEPIQYLSLIHISEPTRLRRISYSVLWF